MMSHGADTVLVAVHVWQAVVEGYKDVLPAEACAGCTGFCYRLLESIRFRC